jgi:Concanavalin A-like lectin/glucanases superfamily
LYGLSGSLGTAFGFNGANSYAFVPQSDALSAMDNDATVAIRMKVSPGNGPDAAAEDDWDVIRSAGQYADGDEYKVEYNPDRTVRCAFKGNAGYREVFSDPAKPLDDGAWHTIKCVKTTTEVKTIVDGVTTSATANIGTIVITKGIIIAAHPSTSATSGASEWLDGELDEASIAFG